MPKPAINRTSLTLADLLFSVGLALLLTHEMDAMTHTEWRILPVLSWLRESSGLVWFVVLHVPIYTIILWLLASTSSIIRWRAQAGTDLFLLLHAGLHTLFSSHSEYTFEGLMSYSLIYGAGLFGLLHLLLLLQKRRSAH